MKPSSLISSRSLLLIALVAAGIFGGVSGRADEVTKRKVRPRPMARAAGQLQAGIPSLKAADREPLLTNLIQIDVFPAVSKGVGASFEHAINSRILAGPYFSIFTTDGEGGENFDIKTQVMLFGLGGRYFLTDNYDRGSFYVSAGLGAAQLNTTANAKYLGQSLGSAQSSITDFGYLAGGGYQFQGWSLGRGSQLVANLGGGYGNGYGVKTTASYMPMAAFTGQPSVQASSQASGSIYLTLAIGLLF